MSRILKQALWALLDVVLARVSLAPEHDRQREIITGNTFQLQLQKDGSLALRVFSDYSYKKNNFFE